MGIRAEIRDEEDDEKEEDEEEDDDADPRRGVDKGLGDRLGEDGDEDGDDERAHSLKAFWIFLFLRRTTGSASETSNTTTPGKGSLGDPSFVSCVPVPSIVGDLMDSTVEDLLRVAIHGDGGTSLGEEEEEEEEEEEDEDEDEEGDFLSFGLGDARREDGGEEDGNGGGATASGEGMEAHWATTEVIIFFFLRMAGSTSSASYTGTPGKGTSRASLDFLVDVPPPPPLPPRVGGLEPILGLLPLSVIQTLCFFFLCTQ